MRCGLIFFFFFKQKTAYEIDCDWSSDVCSSDLVVGENREERRRELLDLDPDLRRQRALHLIDRKSTRLNSSHSQISYAVFCLKKKKQYTLRLPAAIAPRLLTHTQLQ